MNKNGRQRKKNELNKILFLNPNETPKENGKETPNKGTKKKKKENICALNSLNSIYHIIYRMSRYRRNYVDLRGNNKPK